MLNPINEYIALVCEQIRWKRALPTVRRELTTHLLEQKDAYIQDGIEELEAEAEAVRQMGDPIQAGQELDKVHRPKPQWFLLGLVSILALFGGWYRLYLNHYSTRTVILLVVAFAGLLIGYFMDYRLLGRHSGVISVSILVAAILSFSWSNQVTGVYRLASCFLPLLPVAYVLGIYSLRGKGWRGYIAGLLMIPLFAMACFWVPSVTHALLFSVIAVIALIYAVKSGWFQINPKIAYALLVILGVVGSARLLPYYYNRILLSLQPNLDPLGRGYQHFAILRALRSTKAWGVTKPEGIPPFNSQDYILANFALSFGRIPCFVLCGTLIFLVVYAFYKCLHQRKKLGCLLALSAILSIGFQIIVCIATNAGFLLFFSDCPFLSGDAHTVVDMVLMGIALSVFREERLSEVSDLSGHIEHKNGSVGMA